MKTKKRGIHALLCAVLPLAALITCHCPVLAEEVLKLDWADFANTDAAAQGDFQTVEIPDLPSVRLWIPAEMAAVDTGFMDGPFKPDALYGTADQAKSVILFISEVPSLDEYAALMEKEGGGSDFRHIVINGVECILYEVEKDNLESLVYPVSDHMVLSVNFMPMTGDDSWETTKNIILASIQQAE